MELREVTQTVDVPRNTGIDGFIMTLKTLLKQPRIQQIIVDASGKVSYKRLVRDDEQLPIGIDLETVTPYAVVASASVEEMVLPPHTPAAVAIGRMFDRFAIDQVYPIAFTSGVATVFWDWYRVTNKAALHSRSTIFGLPLLLDKRIPDSALILCGSYAPSTSLVDTARAVKLEMETLIMKPPNTDVEIL